jgi:hypothetical protein
MDPAERVDYYCVRQEDGCYVWTGATTKGYGMVQIGGHSYRVHQWVWENANGPLPLGHNLHHLCHNTRCRELSHLELLTASAHWLEHGLRGSAKVNHDKTHCKNDHPLDGDNLWVEKNGARHCKACRAETARRFRAKQKETP